ncbi:hypothetical protein FOL47_005357 [Perkinsus chesapeaki]|uniref:Uncharacterized protein n=1 Tax=Perkinsus chesapeaki TaxID=330153 RepID=A0A7J6N2E4_PERCH|nr:hypothetical protein FOL47_005357 [Perkinsus chesapeaki]
MRSTHIIVAAVLSTFAVVIGDEVPPGTYALITPDSVDLQSLKFPNATSQVKLYFAGKSGRRNFEATYELSGEDLKVTFNKESDVDIIHRLYAGFMSQTVNQPVLDYHASQETISYTTADGTYAEYAS